jgi:transcriptional regulator with XRE-family HTH domain
MIITFASSSLTKSVFTPEYVQCAARIVELRKEAGLTQVELAQRLGRPQSYVSKYERGERRLDVVEFLAVTRALDTDAASLVAELERLSEKPASRPLATRPRGRAGSKPKVCR